MFNSMITFPTVLKFLKAVIVLDTSKICLLIINKTPKYRCSKDKPASYSLICKFEKSVSLMEETFSSIALVNN